MSDDRSRVAASAWAALLAAHTALVPRLDRALQQATGLPLSWYDVLHELAAAPGRRLTMTELAERVVLSRTRVSRIVTELEGAGLVDREGNPDDGRSAFAALTADGLARHRAAAPCYLESIEQHFAASLTDAELNADATALRKAAQQPIGLTLRPVTDEGMTRRDPADNPGGSALPVPQDCRRESGCRIRQARSRAEAGQPVVHVGSLCQRAPVGDRPRGLQRRRRRVELPALRSCEVPRLPVG